MVYWQPPVTDMPPGYGGFAAPPYQAHAYTGVPRYRGVGAQSSWLRHVPITLLFPSQDTCTRMRRAALRHSRTRRTGIAITIQASLSMVAAPNLTRASSKGIGGRRRTLTCIQGTGGSMRHSRCRRIDSTPCRTCPPWAPTYAYRRDDAMMTNDFASCYPWAGADRCGGFT
jgi:hypothetical protein